MEIKRDNVIKTNILPLHVLGPVWGTYGKTKQLLEVPVGFLWKAVHLYEDKIAFDYNRPASGSELMAFLGGFDKKTGARCQIVVGGF